jgi:predicted component of type VI protein secretion system
MRSFIPKLIAAASIFAAIPLSSAYAVHRHHRAAVDTTTTASVPMDPQARAATEQLLGVKQGIRNARELGKISEGQARELMQQADSMQRAGGRSAIAQINELDQRLQQATGQGTYMGVGSDGGYYPNG